MNAGWPAGPLREVRYWTGNLLAALRRGRFMTYALTVSPETLGGRPQAEFLKDGWVRRALNTGLED